MANRSEYRYNRIPDEKLNKLPCLIELQKVTQKKAAEILGISKNVVERYCKKMGIKTQRTGPRNGDQHPGWKGGTKYMKGYRYVHTHTHPNRTHDNYIAEHRLVMEAKLGRYLEKQEVVHHIDGNPLNNDPENLVVCQTNADHLRMELKGRVPNWTPEGKANLQKEADRRRKYEGTKEERARQAWQRYDTVHRNRGFGGGQQPQSSDHQTSLF